MTEPDQFEQDLLACRPKLRSVARRLTSDPNDAEDLVASAFQIALANREKFQHRSSVFTWAHRILVSIFMRRKRLASARSGSVSPLSDNDARCHRAHQPGPALESRETLRAVLRVLNRLPERQREALILTRVHGLSYQQVADRLGITMPAVRSLISRATVTLREEVPDA